MRRLVLLASQAFALGITTAWVLVPSMATFLDAYGSSLLPVTYIGAAVAGAVSTAGLAATLRRRPLVDVAWRVLACFSAAVLIGWAVLVVWSAAWVSFGLMVVVPLLVPIGFMFVVGQAGALLDVRALKAGYGRVIAGFALGYTCGGLVAPLWIDVLGRTEDVLVPAAAAAATFLALVVATKRSYPLELSSPPHLELPGDCPDASEAGGGGERHASIATILRDPYVRLIVVFQFLSAVESQWLDFLVFDRASNRYEGEALAQFISLFTAIAYGADILFLLLLAGLLLRRLGLRYGLTVNSGGVLAVLVAMLVASSVQGGGAALVFVLVVAARITDLVLSDGASRTSLGAAYQVVPGRLRQAAQATVEGLAVPVAIGVSGVALLALEAAGGIDGMALPAMTAAVVAAWAAVAVALFRGYRVNLLSGLRHRELDPSELTVEDADPHVVERLLVSTDVRDVRLGLDTLSVMGSPATLGWLRRLAVDDRVDVRADALRRLVDRDPAAAEEISLASLEHPEPAVRAVAVRVLGDIGDTDALTAVATRVADPSPEVRGAASAVLARSADVAELRTLLHDADRVVRSAALSTIDGPEDVGLVEDVIATLEDRRCAGDAVDALAAIGAAGLDAIDRAMADPARSRAAQEHLARACRVIGGEAAVAVLRRHVQHPDREVGLAVMAAIGALTPARDAAGAGGGGGAAAVPDLMHAARVLHALAACGHDPAAELLRAALRDELTLATERVVAALSTAHGEEAVAKVTFQFAQQDERSHALAVEWLDVTLAGPERAAIDLLQPGLTQEERSRRLDRLLDLRPATDREIIVDLVEDRSGTWRRPWLAACALHAADGHGFEQEVLEAVEARLAAAPAPPDDIVVETYDGLRRRPAQSTTVR